MSDEMKWQGPLWDAINDYVIACGGDPSKRVYGNWPRQSAVAAVNRVVREAVSDAGSSAATGAGR